MNTSGTLQEHFGNSGTLQELFGNLGNQDSTHSIISRRLPEREIRKVVRVGLCGQFKESDYTFPKFVTDLHILTEVKMFLQAALESSAAGRL